MPRKPFKPSPELVTFIIQARLEPFVGDPPYADDFYTAIGRLVLMWGKLEQTLDNLLITVINIAERSGVRQEMQVALGRKLRLLQTLYRDVATLNPLHGRATSLCDRIKKCGDDRHLIIHSNWIGFDDGPPATLVMRHLKHKSGMITVSKVTPQISHLAQMAGNCHGARAETLTLLASTWEVIDPEIWQKAHEQAQRAGGHFPPIEL